MEIEIENRDIADTLLIVNKYTIERLFKLENCETCIALYIFYYKTAKWQKTNIVKATDEYVKKSLKIGAEKLKKAKETLKENGLIEVIQRRKENKIVGWYIQVNYLVSEKTVEEIKIKVENDLEEEVESKNSQNQEVAKPRSRKQETNALKENNKCLLNINKKDKSLEKTKKESATELIEKYSHNLEVRKALYDFLDMRKQNRKPTTIRALNILLKKLSSLAQEDTTKIAILEESIANNWQSIYPLKNEQGNSYSKNATTTNNSTVDREARLAKLREVWNNEDIY